ncbi:MAG: prepilin-type N-terminal cleavage/methylation domain-containing protein [Gammaproteobacteria bacterium]|nr:prepilin-type N-terminal cleavage/methylation domain-containing protein [Gammaproteobacteria bacterium]
MVRATRGFSLVELILVIILLGIVSTLSLGFLRNGAEMYAQSADRERLLSQSRFVIERLTRELRNALPNSVRISSDGRCIEFIPLKFAGRYGGLPGVTADPASYMRFFTGQSSDVINFSSLIDEDEGDFITVYPTQPEHYYSQSRTLELKAATAEDEGSGQKVTLEFNSATATGFPQASPNQRFFIWDFPVRYCLLAKSVTQNNDLYDIYRFSDYGVIQQEPQVGDLDKASGSLMATDIVRVPGLRPFSDEDAVLTRSSVVHVVLSFSSNFADDLFFNQEIHIPNVP